MVRIYRQMKMLLMALVLLYLSIYIFRLLHAVKLDQDRLRLIEKISQDPLCTAHSGVVNRLSELTQDLINLRLNVDNDPAWINKLDSYYDNLQQLLNEIKTITNLKHADKKEKRDVKSKGGVSAVVCPEIYHGTTYGYPFYTKGFETTNCSSKVPMERLVTLIFDRVPVARKTDQGEIIADQSNYVERLLDFINSVYHFYPKVQSYLALNITENVMDSLKSKVKRKEIKFVKLTNVTRGRAIQDVINQVDTAYVLIANQLTHFTKHIDLERLIRVLSSHNSAVIAGASSRNLTGHWSNNCYRSQLKNYTLYFKSGYHRSINECLVCDHIAGSFLAKTSILKTIKFDSSLNHGLYEDFFLRLKYQHYGNAHNQRDKPLHGNTYNNSSSNYGHNGDYEKHFNHNNNINDYKGNNDKHLNRYHARDIGYYGSLVAVSCPDVMFHEQKDDVRDEDLFTFASRHSIKKIVEANGRVRWYGCKRDIKYRTGDRCTLRGGLAVAPCCLENLADAVKFVMDECERSNVVCELQEGTLLGAVKFNKALPWERDADITFLTSDYEKLLTMKTVTLDRGYLWRDISKSRDI